MPESVPALRPITPASLPPPFAAYSHAVLAPPGAAVLAISGQLGMAPDGSIPDADAPGGAEAQADLAFSALRTLLAEAGMGPADVLRLNAYVTERRFMGPYMAARDRFVASGGGAAPASTLLIVSGFTRPEFVVEVEALAARAGSAP